jgi:hypothetical protein
LLSSSLLIGILLLISRRSSKPIDDLRKGLRLKMFH